MKTGIVAIMVIMAACLPPSSARAQRDCASWNVANRVIFDEDPRAQRDCANWNSEGFFGTDSAADVRACLRAGADPGARDEYGNTPLHHAALGGHAAAIAAHGMRMA